MSLVGEFEKLVFLSVVPGLCKDSVMAKPWKTIVYMKVAFYEEICGVSPQRKLYFESDVVGLGVWFGNGRRSTFSLFWRCPCKPPTYCRFQYLIAFSERQMSLTLCGSFNILFAQTK